NTDMQTNIGFNCNGVTNVFALEPITNNPPTLTLTSPADNQTLTEGSTYKLEGTVSDVDVGNALSVKYSIGGGPTQTIALGTSDGSTAKSFNKTLKYSQGRFWDGATDVSGLLPAEASSIQIWANDGIDDSAKVTRNFTVVQEDGKIIIPVNVVSAGYLVSRMAPPVRLSNGWLVGAVKDTSVNRIAIYKSTDNGKIWMQLSALNTVPGEFSLTSKGMSVYILASMSSTQILAYRFDVTTVGASITGGVSVESGQTALGAIDLKITPDGTTLRWAASTKNATYPNSFNIRAGSIPINADGTLGTPSAVSQATTYDIKQYNCTNPVLVFRDGLPVIVFQYNGTSMYNNIYSLALNGSEWPVGVVYQGGESFVQSSPTVCATPNTKLHTAWHGTDATDSANPWIRYSNASVGALWLPTPKKLVKGQNACITSDKSGKLFITYEDGGVIKRIESTNEFASFQGPFTIGVGTVPASQFDPTFQTDFTIPPTIYQATGAVKYYGSLIVNKKPVVTLTTPDNQTLTENATYDVAGNAVDEDVGNVVTVYYKINNGPPQAAASGISDGSTPILFSKQLTYKNKRVYLGTTDITGADLAENVDHILTVWAEDNKQGKSTEVTRKFKVVWNRPPVISDSNRDLGIMEAPPSVKYEVTDQENNPFTVTEKIDGEVIRTYAGVSGRQETITIPHHMWLRVEPGVLHNLTIEATDDQGMTSKRTYTLTRFVDKITFNGMDYALLRPETREFFTTDVAAKRLLLTPMWDLPPGVNLLVEACNNGYDASPTWEDATHVVKTGRIHMFNNTTKSADKWGINFRFRIEKGSAIFPVYFKGVGGAFD
ncbi:Ig-like domain-containing protein, partial [Brevibacillus reuszeri]|uniref:Ig-like domain-containing protein n=1 Tax=Brevibacillus reuszeri TaxID=54915 RepID=UPI001F37CC1C